MADYHVLKTDEAGNALQVVFHIPIPNITNDASYNIRQAIVDWLGGHDDPTVIQSRCPFISPTELAQIQAGEIFEKTIELSSNPTETYPEKQVRLDAQYTIESSNVQSLIQTVLQYWGYERIIP